MAKLNIAFSRFSGPKDQRTSEITVDGVSVGWIECAVIDESGRTERAGTRLLICGYSVHGLGIEIEFKTLKEARDYCRKHWGSKS